jgi:hypothetical protein
MGGGGGLGAADWIFVGFEEAGQLLEEVGDEGGDGGVVFGGQAAGLTVEIGGNCDGDVAGISHVWISLRVSVS